MSSGGHSPKSGNLFLNMSDLSAPVHRTSGRDDNVRVFLLIVIMKKWKKICRIIFLAYLCNPKTNGDSS